MDGSAATGLANEVTITTDGLLILMIVCMVIVTVGFAIVIKIVNKHVEDCTGYRRGFHTTDGELKNDVTELKSDIRWIKRHLGWKGDEE